MSDLIADSDVNSSNVRGLYPVFDIKDTLIGWRRFPQPSDDAWSWTAEEP